MKKQLAQLHAVGTGRVIIPHLEVAGSLWAQTVGLMGRKEIAPDAGLLIPRCNAIHTAFVRFPIDVMFLDKDLTAVRLIPALSPWRIIGFVRGANSVVELPAGTLRQKQIVVGQQFALHLSAPERTGERT
jgi:uncharacterized membrane protein (UPF0127 family)